MVLTEPFNTMMLDEIKFDDVVALPGMPAALLMACPMTGDVQVALCYPMPTVKAPTVILTQGIPQLSIPMIVVSDSKPEFASPRMQQLAKIFGVEP